MALVALPIDQGLNVLYRQTGMSATAANALSGATSTAVVGVGGIGASVAMGELALGPEMIPAALLTLLFTGIAAGLGAASGSEEDKARKKATDTVEAQYRLIQALRANEFDAVAARASLPSLDQQLITDDFLNTVHNVLDGKTPTGAKTAAQLRSEKQAALDQAQAYARRNHFGMRQLARSYSRIDSRYDSQIKAAEQAERMQQLSTRLIQARLNATVSGKPFADPLSSAENAELQKLDPDYARRAQVYSSLFHTRSVEQATHMNELEADIVTRVQKGEQVDLTDDERQILSLDPDFAQRLQNAMKPQIDRESADRLGLSLDQYYSYAADVHNGMREQSAYQKQLLSQAREAGYMSISDYQLAQRSEKDAAQVKEDERAFAQSFLNMQKEAKEAGYYTVDEFAYQGRMTEWTPKSSQIMKAHEMGLTQQEYLDYMSHLAAGNTNAYTMAKDAHHGSEQEERRLDDLHFQDELLAAGYDPTQGYASLEGDVVHGFEEEGFLRFDTDPFMYDYDHFDPGKKDATKAQQYISGRSPNYGATAPGAVVAKLDALKSQSVVRNEPGQAIADEVRIIQRDGHAYLNIPSAAS